MNSDPVTIYHNPQCGTSRNTLALIRACGVEPIVIEYLKDPPDRATLARLAERSGNGVRGLLRIKGTPYKELGLDAPELTDDELIGHILRNPILLNRPVVVSSAGVALCRPSDLVARLLPQHPATDLFKEDGAPVLVDVPVDGQDESLRKALHDASLATGDLAEPGRHFFAYATVSGARIGYGGYEALGEHVLLRSIVVDPSARGHGAGAGIVGLLLRRAYDQGARQAWLLTDTAAGFFERSGFKPASREQAPAAVQATRQASSLCTDSATLMTRSISP